MGFIFIFKTTKSAYYRENILSWFFGIIFGFGLLLSGMCRPSKVLGFLIINSDRWDPSLAFVMASAVAINVVTFNFILIKKTKPIHANSFSVPPPQGKVDLRLIMGASIFGLGWGWAGLCPGPGVICLFRETHAVFWIVGLVIGQLSFDIGIKKLEKLKEKREVNPQPVEFVDMDSTKKDSY